MVRIVCTSDKPRIMNIYPIFAVGTNLELSKFQFRSEGYSYATQWVLFGFLGIIILGVGIATYLYLRRRRQFEEMQEVREETRIKMLLSEFNLREEDKELFETFTESTSPGRYIPLLESKQIFEDTIKDFRTRFPNHPGLKQVGKLRQRLGYGFANPRNKFNDTRMLPTGTRLQCKVPRVTKDLNFLTNIVATTEDHFFVRPPTSKGKPLLLKGVPNMTFKVSREDDAEYEFIATISGQMEQGIRAIAVAHTTEVQKLMFRNAPRLDVDLETRFFIVKKEAAGSKTMMAFKAADSQYSFNGRIKDLSIGGSLLVTPSTKNNPEVGDMAVFQVHQAQIHEDLVAEVVRLTPLPDNFLQVHLRFQGIKEINRLKLNRFLEELERRTQQEKDAG